MSFSSFVRTKVSRNKRRFKENGFDLDLSYINTRLVAMGFPSENVEGVYRNPFKEVFRFLEIKHKDHYKVYNLCSERDYDISKFHNRVEKFPFDDHNAPPFHLIFEFCKNVQEWLNQDPKNIAVIHCKAGKGRTGLMICSYLLYSGEWKTAEDSLSFYGAMRTYNKKGVTIPSQIRYVHYVAQAMQNGGELPPKKTCILNSITVHTLPKISYEDTKFQVFMYKTLAFSSKDKPIKTGGKKKGKDKSKEDEVEEETLVFTGGCPVSGDVKIQFFVGSSDNKLFHFWFNTSFVPENGILELNKSEIDKVNKDKHHKVYKENFKITLNLQVLENSNDHVELVSQSTPPLETEEEKSFTIISERKEVKEYENGVLNRSGKCTETQRKATEVVESLLTQIIEIYVISAKQDIDQIQNTKEFSALELATAELQKVSLEKLSAEEKLCFWINSFNLLALHANIIYPPASSLEGRFEIMGKAKYEIAGQLFSLLDIEFGVLRNKSSSIPDELVQASSFVKKFGESDPRKGFALSNFEPRINFALNPGTTSAPLVRIYHPSKLFDELDQATRTFLQENTDVNSGSREVYLPKILEWYHRDFAKTPEKMIRDLAGYFTTEQKSELIATGVKTVYEPYDWSFHYSFKHFDVARTTQTSNDS